MATADDVVRKARYVAALGHLLRTSGVHGLGDLSVAEQNRLKALAQEIADNPADDSEQGELL